MTFRFLPLLALGSLVFAQDPLAPKKVASNIELTVDIVSGLAQPPAGAKDEVPADLSSVVRQFHSVFMYKAYKLIDEFQLRSSNMGGAEIGGELDYFNGGQYNFRYKLARVLPGQHTVALNGLRLEITRRPPGPSAVGASPLTVILVATDLVVGDGEKTVLGKSAVNGDAWFLVVVPKIIY